MKPLMKFLVLLLAVALMAAACGDDDATTTAAEATTTTAGATTTAAEATTTTAAAVDYGLVTDGVLTMCTDPPYAPMEFEQDGVYVGFDVDLMRAIATTLGLDLEVVTPGWDAITSGAAMETDICDISASSITILPEREENIDFSDPYFTADQSLLVKADSGITSLADFASGRNLGVQSGTTGEIYAQANDPGANIISYDDPGLLFVALDAGEIDGVLQDIIPNAEQALNDETVIVAEIYPTEEQYGFAVKEEGSETLLAAVNAALADLMADGTYDQIYETWFPSG